MSNPAGRSPFDRMWDAFMKDAWNWQEHKKQEKKKEPSVKYETVGSNGDIEISSNFSKHKVVMVVGEKQYNWTATLGTDSAREYARQLIAAADAVDAAKKDQKTVPTWVDDPNDTVPTTGSNV